MNEILLYALMPVGAVVLYLLPWFVAMARNTRNRSWVALLDIVFGWTVIGWFVALILASEGQASPRRI